MHFSLFNSPCPNLLPLNVRNTKLTINCENTTMEATIPFLAEFLQSSSHSILLEQPISSAAPEGCRHPAQQLCFPRRNYRRHSSPQPVLSQCGGAKQGMSARERSVSQFPELRHQGNPGWPCLGWPAAPSACASPKCFKVLRKCYLLSPQVLAVFRWEDKRSISFTKY